MPSSPLTSAIIGCGAIAHEHVRFLTRSPLVRLASVADRSLATAQFFKEHYGAGEAFDDASAMLANVKPDVVHILTPPGSHEALIRMAIDAGCHVICEKPMSAGLAQTRALLDYAAAKDRTLVEGNNAIWNDNVVALRKRVADGQLGDIREIEVSIALDIASGPFGDRNLGDEGINLPAGAIHDFLPHLCGLFVALSGAMKFEEVTGRLGNLSGNPRVVYDYLDCTVRAGAIRGHLRFSPDVNPPSFRIAARGTEASAETDFYNPYLRMTGGRYTGKLAPFELISSGRRMIGAGVRNFRDKIGGVTPYHGIDRMLAGVYEALATGAPSPITQDYMLRVAELTERISDLRNAPR